MKAKGLDEIDIRDKNIKRCGSPFTVYGKRSGF